MRIKTILLLVPFLAMVCYAIAQIPANESQSMAARVPSGDEVGEINWMSFNDLNEIAQSKKWKHNDKKVFVDMYTAWCGWCKKMDATTFQDPRVIRYMNEHYYAIKFDAETKETITFGDKTYEWVPGGRNGINKLARALGVSGYPSYAFLDEELAKIQVVPGYKDVKTLMTILVYMAEDAYQKTPYKEFAENFDLSQY